jgi:sirohydrochlorin cobaltochelatase
MKKAVLLVGHGSRRNGANQALLQMVDMVALKRPGIMVAHAFLQFAQPDLPAALRELADKGVEEVIVVPIFLYEGVHIHEDIPQILAEEGKNLPGLRMRLAPVLGIDERMAQIVWERVDSVTK